MMISLTFTFLFCILLLSFVGAFHSHFPVIRKIQQNPVSGANAVASRVPTKLNQHIQTSFNEFLDSMDAPILVDFYAEWCGPCRMMTPVLQDMAGRFDNILKIAKIDADKAADIASKYEVEALPTLILFYKGEIIDRFIGYRDANTFEKELVKVRISF